MVREAGIAVVRDAETAVARSLCAAAHNEGQERVRSVMHVRSAKERATIR